MSSKSYPKVTEGFVQHMVITAYPTGYAGYHNSVIDKKKMKIIFKIALVVLTGIVTISCNSLKLDDYYYYYPTNTNSTYVYLYVNPNNSELNEYWKVTSYKDTQTLLTESYDANFRLYNTFKEKLDKESYKLIEYSEYEYQGTYADQEIKSKISDNDVFGFDKEKKYKYAVDYTNSYGKFNFTKERKYLGIETVEIQNQEYKVIKFSDKYYISAIDLNDSYEFEQTTYYAKDVGMVKYERYIPNEETRVLELQEVMNEEEFINMMNKSSR